MPAIIPACHILAYAILQYLSKAPNGCSFFVVARNGPALLGMPDCEQLLILNCQSPNDQHWKWQINVQTKQDNLKLRNNR